MIGCTALDLPPYAPQPRGPVLICAHITTLAHLPSIRSGSTSSPKGLRVPTGQGESSVRSSLSHPFPRARNLWGMRGAVARGLPATPAKANMVCACDSELGGCHVTKQQKHNKLRVCVCGVHRLPSPLHKLWSRLRQK